ncbi:MAG TPA: hypothetical protein VFM18_05245 [Methanosarcina sp.]|nr:hypothetical protein [Methanosarcina sp.]
MTQPLSLDDLLNRLSMTKQASESSDDDKEKKEKKEDDKEKSSDSSKDEKKENPFEKMKNAEKDAENSKKEEDRVKEAQLQGAALAQEIMQKAASAQITTNKEDSQMNKSAAVAGKALADSLLQKLAAAGDFTTTNGIPAGVVPNKAQVDNAQSVAEHDVRVQPTPTADAKGDNGGSINQIFDAIIADAMSAGAATPDELPHQSLSSAEGATEAHSAPNAVEAEGVGEEVEKAAAVSALVNSGFDFTSAVEMVKAAAEELAAEHSTQVKQAALGQLIDAGVDYNLAIAMVKQANALVPAGGRALMGAAKKGAGFMERHGRKIAIGAGAAGVGAAAGYALNREKQAAVNGLVDAGVDFDSAVALVAEKAAELYGA